MDNLRTYGAAPYTVAAIHGGPGVPGSLALVAQELGHTCGVLEPLQTADTLDGQIAELRAILIDHAAGPVILVGWSWGAMLSFVFTARHPELVKKLILIGSGGLEQRHAAPVMQTRLSRLSDADRATFERLSAALNNPATVDKNSVLAQIGELFKTRTDTYRALPIEEPPIHVQYAIHLGAWQGMADLRASGELLALADAIACPVRVLHGDYDPHPLAGIRDPLAARIADFRCEVFADCGHYPWLEAAARDRFFEVLRAEVRM